MPTISSLPTLSSRDVRRSVLPNGLVVLTRETHVSPTVSTMLWYRVGSRNEQPGETGRSHFLEHMQFKGTDRYAKGEIDLLTMKNGALLHGLGRRWNSPFPKR